MTQPCVCSYISTLACVHREGAALKRNGYNEIYSATPIVLSDQEHTINIQLQHNITM